MIHEKATQPDTGQTSPKMFLEILRKIHSWLLFTFETFQTQLRGHCHSWLTVLKTDLYRKTKTQIVPNTSFSFL